MNHVAAQRSDGLQQFPHLARGLAVVQAGLQFQRLRHALQIGGQLGLECFVEHGTLLCMVRAKKNRTSRRRGLHGAVRPGAESISRKSLPTKSSEGVRVLAPSIHLAGQTWPGLAAVHWAALGFRTVSLTSRAVSLEWISGVLIRPSGLMMKVPGSAKPSCGICTPKAWVCWWVGLPTKG